MSALDHVRWVGGGSGAGKSTVTRLLAERFDLGVYSTDSVIGFHSTLLDADGCAAAGAFR